MEKYFNENQTLEQDESELSEKELAYRKHMNISRLREEYDWQQRKAQADVEALQRTGADYLIPSRMSGLFTLQFEKLPEIVEGLFARGTYILAGSPKVGKSFLAIEIALAVSMGRPLWGREVNQCDVMYYALEDTPSRLQQRLNIMADDECINNDHLFYSCQSPTLSTGFPEQLRVLLNDYPNIKMVIIDTLQKVRDYDDGTYSYSKDYEVIGQLKELADDKDICLILIHHTRKQKSDDCFDMISGTNGLMGCADGALVLYKEERSSDSAKLIASGRDIRDQKLRLKRNRKTLAWEFDGEDEDTSFDSPKDEILDSIIEYMSSHSYYQGTATQVCEVFGIECNPNVLSRRLNVIKSKLENEYSIKLRNKAIKGKRYISFEKIEEVDEYGGVSF